MKKPFPYLRFVKVIINSTILSPSFHQQKNMKHGQPIEKVSVNFSNGKCSNAGRKDAYYLISEI
ncbi:MAG: hypothetical protein EAZ08_05995 [Cytophagales bacterium]|nr:MAG: hypothetical protein EAZ08_05995 [Cytophagales bacterium]